jgi:hypothetical protein
MKSIQLHILFKHLRGSSGICRSFPGTGKPLEQPLPKVEYKQPQKDDAAPQQRRGVRHFPGDEKAEDAGQKGVMNI